ncbi:hypothetical protein J6590_050178 [Homalodisca vitripennis]|nr:hypothetical protein J6590_050178 [Homalodisca vitripennis]
MTTQDHPVESCSEGVKEMIFSVVSKKKMALPAEGEWEREPARITKTGGKSVDNTPAPETASKQSVSRESSDIAISSLS